MICLGQLWAVLAWFWNMHELPVWMPRIPHCPTSLLQYAYRGVTAILAVLVIVGVARKALDSSNRFKNSSKKSEYCHWAYTLAILR